MSDDNSDTSNQETDKVDEKPSKRREDKIPEPSRSEVEIEAVSDAELGDEEKKTPKPKEKSKSEDDLEQEDDADLEDDSSEPANDQFFETEDFSEAYDLDHGELIKHDPNDPLSGLPSKNIVGNAKEFFSTEILYRFDILEDHERKKLKGSYLIELQGDTGGSWTLEIEDDLEISNEKKDAEVTLNMRPKDFVLMVNGELNPQLSLLSGKFKVKGDYNKAVTIQTLLSPHSD